jgi:hypothetical protein
VSHRVIGTLAAAPFGFFATVFAFIDGWPGLVAGPLTGVLVGLIAAELSRTRGLRRIRLRVPASIILSWVAGIALFPIVTFASLAAWRL